MENHRQHQQKLSDGGEVRYMQKFRLYETYSKFYMIGRDKSRTYWKVLKIDRLEPSELTISEDSTVFSETESSDILRRIHEGNKPTGGLKFVTTCYGIIGFIKFLGPYYMLLITKRKKIGTICGHNIYAITKSQMITVPHIIMLSKMAYSNDENRYKKLLCSVDLTRDFFFSYSYHIMHSLQKNLSANNPPGLLPYETLFVWNEYLTRGIRNTLQNTSWTVALVHGFFKQVEFSISDRKIILTIIARRSRHFAGTRYLKRGVNEKGRVANDVETEQIVFADAHDGDPMQISSAVQIRGSIPLFWSQEASPLNMKPDIILSKKDQKFEATQLHFENLVKRYGNPIVILNLIKTREKKPRETILGVEFANAVRFINKNCGEIHLRFFDWDLHQHSRCSKATDVLTKLRRVAADALKLTGIFYCHVTRRLGGSIEYSNSVNCVDEHSTAKQANSNKANVDEDRVAKDCLHADESVDYIIEPLMFQSGVLRTNCIDCLDRTNVAQYAYGLAALGRQLETLGFFESSNIDLDDPIAMEIMALYEAMGDTLALQYGGSGAHNKIFSEKKGQWKAATQSREYIRSFQRYYSNTYLDGNKQKSINLFLGHFQPQQGKPALWELDSDQYCTVGKHGPSSVDSNVRSTIRRSLSDGSILCENDTTIRSMEHINCQHSGKSDQHSLLEVSPDIRICGSDVCHCRQIYSGEFEDPVEDHICYDEHGNAYDCSDVLDVDWPSSSANSCEEETLERSTFISSKNISNELRAEKTGCTRQSESCTKIRRRGQIEVQLNKDTKFTKSFGRWVNHENGGCFWSKDC
ncbi:hypothetical protein HN51_014370 [Arachis hypogaea]|uniref:phosphoinositide phosphatase SAC2 isoform X1 n=2 Tax=Arachis hypogaea TaxID=3818 RepID=UPI000DEC49B9|nr:phosphoinositide phosphatase SAC2 isoform X1 [Arachis hypogaea]QHO45435.1 Phosphoinositide phosphatase [Arachis hypogaea]